MTLISTSNKEGREDTINIRKVIEEVELHIEDAKVILMAYNLSTWRDVIHLIYLGSRVDLISLYAIKY